MIYKKPEELRVLSCEDTDFANCTETRRSVGSDVQTIGGTLVGWEVGSQDGVGTSTTDVEYRQLAKGWLWECTLFDDAVKRDRMGGLSSDSDRGQYECNLHFEE